MELGSPNQRNEKFQEKTVTLLPHIPYDIILYILSRTPVKSLLRFRCVSKSWCALISDPKFNLSIQQRKIVAMRKHDGSFPACLIDDEASVTELPEPEPLTDLKPLMDSIPVMDGRLRCVVTIRGSCNGLLLLNVWEDLFLWNPLTGCNRKVISHQRLSRRYPYKTVSGLCYDSSTDDYKAVLAVADLWDRTSLDKVVMAGSFKNRVWTEIPFPKNMGIVQSGTTVNERLHWLVTEYNDYGRSYLIFYFDPPMNELVKVSMPRQEGTGRGKYNLKVLGLGVLHGCLSMVTREGSGVEILAMTKYGDEASWTRWFRIPTVERLDYVRDLVPLCGTKNGVLLLQQGNYDVVLEYKSGRKVPSEFMFPYRTLGIGAVVLEESLVSPPRYEWEEEEYTEILLSGATLKWKRGDSQFNLIDS
ncbi:F-box protein At4g22390-like [Rhododendron vialii]|uniref:F-box protein At4g22390-like n=1 Tax=Rhododendron vialii TaxID=182163 RepID=UPI00265DFDE2|nr:F-box protein At4g22390-like [Rhododendron vialii]